MGRELIQGVNVVVFLVSSQENVKERLPGANCVKVVNNG
jgi:hypothetical protein